jgi:hypothetical protein
VWFALTRRSNLDRGVKPVLERTGQVVKVFKKGTKVAASKGSFSTGKLRSIQSLEDWCVWACKAATQAGLDTVGAQANATGRNAESGPDRGDPIHEALMAAQAGTSGSTGESRETARIRILKHRLDAIRLTTDGVVPLDLACASSREALLARLVPHTCAVGLWWPQMARSRNAEPWGLHSWPKMGKYRHVV